VSEQPEAIPPQPPFDYQKWVHEMKREDAQRDHDRISAFISNTNEAAINNANLALRTAVIINGGAAVSVLAFVGGLVTKGNLAIVQEVSFALESFAIGVATATLAMGFSYFTHYCITGNAARKELNWEHPYTRDTSASKWYLRAGLTFQAISILLGFGSVVFFLTGMLAVKASFAHLI
jgi:hypothetical protein